MIMVKQPQFTWIHLKNATKGDIENIQAEYDFHELIREDLLELSGENKVDYYEEDQAVTILMNFPKYDTKLERYLHNPFVIIVSHQYVLSICKHNSQHIDSLAKKAQDKTYLEDDASTPTFDLVYDIIDTMYDKSVKGLAKASQDVVKLQDNIGTNKDMDKNLLEEIMDRKINMITLQHIFRPQRQTLHEFKSILKKILRTDEDEVADAKLYIEDLDSKLDKILDNISLNYESLKSLAETYGDMIDLQTNKNISRLTVVTVGTGFMSGLAGLYGMNVILPGAEKSYMFWVIIALGLCTISLGYALLKRKKMI
ncbi:CorA-like Mg2+ transporter protein [candidate division SR1 bacterium Aalborg_AAW-1]|nr:CorA-like Mg2+ transporter protein [candidate division SR1 bacterium Aalborg_AAW-1]